jgi:hypothetical protein
MPLQQDKLLHARHRPPGWLHGDAGDRVCADAAVRANCRLLAVSTTLQELRGTGTGRRRRKSSSCGGCFSDGMLGFSDGTWEGRVVIGRCSAVTGVLRE